MELPRHSSPDPFDPTPQSKFKAEREAALKATAGNKTAWNALFMRYEPHTTAATRALAANSLKGGSCQPPVITYTRAEGSGVGGGGSWAGAWWAGAICTA